MQPFLPGREISVPVFPRGLYPDGLHDSAWSLPPILKIDHINGIFPKHYVPVMADLCMQKICKECESIVDFFNVKGPVCFECRQDDAGEYQIFDMDLQPDLSLDFPFKKRNIQNSFFDIFFILGQNANRFFELFIVYCLARRIINIDCNLFEICSFILRRAYFFIISILLVLIVKFLSFMKSYC